MKTLLIVSAFLICFVLFGGSKEEKNTELTTKNEEDNSENKGLKPMKKVRLEYFRHSEESINRYLENLTKLLKNTVKEPEKNSYLALESKTSQLESIMKSTSLEVDTGLYQWWYNKLYKNLLAMCAPKRAMEYAKLNKDEKKYEGQKALFIEQINLYRKIISADKKKAVIPDDKLTELRKKKEQAEREARKKKNR